MAIIYRTPKRHTPTYLPRRSSISSLIFPPHTKPDPHYDRESKRVKLSSVAASSDPGEGNTILGVPPFIPILITPPTLSAYPRPTTARVSAITAEFHQTIHTLNLYFSSGCELWKWEEGVMVQKALYTITLGAMLGLGPEQVVEFWHERLVRLLRELQREVDEENKYEECMVCWLE